VKVTKLHIDEYKVFKDFDIDFTHNGEAQNLIVLAGINGTGKTTLLEFIFTVISSTNISYSDEIHGNNFVDILDEKIKFYLTKNIAKIDNGLVRISCDDRILEEQDKHKDYFNKYICFFRLRHFDHSDYDEDYRSVPYNRTEISLISQYIDKLIYTEGVNPFDSYLKLSSFISEILKSFNLDFVFLGINSDRTPRFENFQGKEITLFDLSTGERQIISLVVNLHIAGIKDSIILIDEPEFSLHPSWQNRIVGVLQKYADEYNCQVILATHSPHIIGSVKPEQLRLLYKDESGAIKVKNQVNGSYGWPVDKVLVGLMDVNTLRTPGASKDLEELNDMVRKNEFESDEFKTKMAKLEDTIGADDDLLTRLRFEIIKRRKDGAANK
jgi:predicted ATP-binding protein involved in virulence